MRKIIIASIDLMEGRAVQLVQGNEEAKVLEREDVLALAREFDRYGETAIIDLDAAMGKGDNLDLIREILGITECRVGGGVTTPERARELVSWGASKVIVGSRAFENDALNREFLQEMAEAVGKDRLIVAVDSREGEVVTKAWKHATGLRTLDVVGELEPYASELLFTCVEKEGGMKGTDMEAARAVREAAVGRLTVAGGVTTLEEAAEIARLGADVQLGMALYTGRMRLDDAFIACLDTGDSLVPTITADESGQVLMLAYSNADSLKKTFETGRVWYYSRSREKLWMKGETSGNFQEFVRVRADCDRDALLVTARQTGPACHTGSYSCFGDRRFSIRQLYDVITDRFESAAPGSYTATLTDEKVREKLLEEAREVVEAQGRGEVIWEAADVLYFLLALMAREGVGPGEVLNELRRRRRK